MENQTKLKKLNDKEENVKKLTNKRNLSRNEWSHNVVCGKYEKNTPYYQCGAGSSVFRQKAKNEMI